MPRHFLAELTGWGWFLVCMYYTTTELQIWDGWIDDGLSAGLLHSADARLDFATMSGGFRLVYVQCLRLPCRMMNGGLAEFDCKNVAYSNISLSSKACKIASNLQRSYLKECLYPRSFLVWGSLPFRFFNFSPSLLLSFSSSSSSSSTWDVTHHRQTIIWPSCEQSKAGCERDQLFPHCWALIRSFRNMLLCTWQRSCLPAGTRIIGWSGNWCLAYGALFISSLSCRSQQEYDTVSMRTLLHGVVHRIVAP